MPEYRYQPNLLIEGPRYAEMEPDPHKIMDALTAWLRDLGPGILTGAEIATKRTRAQAEAQRQLVEVNHHR